MEVDHPVEEHELQAARGARGHGLEKPDPEDGLGPDGDDDYTNGDQGHDQRGHEL